MSAQYTRKRIIEAADRLFYERGFEATSFAEIAAAVDLSRGNFYYHFKTKDEILEAVLVRRGQATRDMLAAWESASDTPVERILAFVQMLIVNQAKIMAFGCPVGGLSNELAKLSHPAKAEAIGLFLLFRDWLADQFMALGREQDSQTLALHLLMRSQGVATLATAFGDEAFVRCEVADMTTWLAAQVPAIP
jgi:TetR/AcrR family transcriptional repressor of nem operon